MLLFFLFLALIFTHNSVFPQNGNIIDGLELWKNNIDKKFDGVDDCMICFSVIQLN